MVNYSVPLRELGDIQQRGNTQYNGDFLLTWEKTDPEIKSTLLIARMLRDMYHDGIDTRAFKTGLAVSNFRDKSTRTRLSWASAASLLGLSLMDFDESKSQVSHGETTRETAAMISFTTEAIGIRDDIFLGHGHTYMQEVSEAVQQAYDDKILPQRPSVVNLQCDLDHPTQTLCDLLHLEQQFGSFDALKGKKIAMTWAYSPSYGKPMSVPQGIITLMTRMGMDVVLAHPEGYNLVPETLEIAKKHAEASGGSFTQVHSMDEAFKGVDIVYPKSWAPVHIMEARTNILKGNGSAQEKDVAVKDLEKKCVVDNAKFQDWTCNENMMNLTKEGSALYMHCLPADITDVNCKAGEVSAQVFDKYRTQTYQEAEWKLYVMAAMILLNRFERPDWVMADMAARMRLRRINGRV